MAVKGWMECPESQSGVSSSCGLVAVEVALAYHVWMYHRVLGESGMKYQQYKDYDSYKCTHTQRHISTWNHRCTQTILQ